MRANRPTGFVLARRLIHLGLECIVTAPTKTERKPNEKVRTDRRAAKKLVKLLRNGDLTPGYIPPASDEALRDVCRDTRFRIHLRSLLLV